MKKNIIIIFFGFFLLITIGISNLIYKKKKYGHHSDFETYKQYEWIFKDSIKQEIDKNYSFSHISKRDVYNDFFYRKNDHNIILWEFKDLQVSDLKSVQFNANVEIDLLKFKSWEILNKRSDLEVNIKYAYSFDNSLNVNLDSDSKIEKAIESSNYKGFIGYFNKLSLSNKKNEHQIIFNSKDGKTPIVFLLYKGRDSFYLIVFFSYRPFKENILEILNLN